MQARSTNDTITCHQQTAAISLQKHSNAQNVKGSINIFKTLGSDFM